jgi:hypothetical protein
MLKQFWIDVRVRLVALFARRGLRARAAEELEFHLAMREQRLVESGLPPTDARAQARREFGNPTLVTDQTLDSWRYTFLDALLQDVRYGLRTLRRNPGFAATAVLSLALGIGANTAIFNLLNALLLRTLPVRAPEELVLVTQHLGDFQTTMQSSRHREAFSGSESLAGLCGGKLFFDPGCFGGARPYDHGAGRPAAFRCSGGGSRVWLLAAPVRRGQEYHRTDDRAAGPGLHHRRSRAAEIYRTRTGYAGRCHHSAQ